MGRPPGIFWRFLSARPADRCRSSSIPLNNDEVCICAGVANSLRALILGAAIAGNSGCVIPKLNDDIALTGAALHCIEATAADKKPGAILVKGRSCSCQVFGIA